MSSKRLPGKTLAKLNGKPMLQYLAENIKQCSASNGFVIATSDDKSDDPVEVFCKSQDIRCFRGCLDNVACRYAELLKDCGADCCVRLSGDSPLLDYRLVDKALDLYSIAPCDLVTNVLERTFPSGMSVEALCAESYLKIYGELEDPYDKEHVTNLLL